MSLAGGQDYGGWKLGWENSTGRQAGKEDVDTSGVVKD